MMVRRVLAALTQQAMTALLHVLIALAKQSRPAAAKTKSHTSAIVKHVCRQTLSNEAPAIEDELQKHMKVIQVHCTNYQLENGNGIAALNKDPFFNA